MATDHGAERPAAAVSDRSLSSAAVIAGGGLLLVVAASIASFPVLEGLLVPGDAGATTAALLENATQFRLAIVGVALIVALDVVVAWALYVFLRPVSRRLSMLAMLFRVVYAAVFGAALGNLLTVAELLNGATGTGALEPDQLHALVLANYTAFQSGWELGLGLFGVHLLLLGYLAIEAGYVPTALGALLVIAGVGYVIDSLVTVLPVSLPLELATVTFVGEVVLLIWLLYRGRTITQSETSAGPA